MITIRNSKQLFAILITAIYLLGILPLSAGAVTPNPAPYYGAKYVLSSTYGDDEYMICHGNIGGDSLPSKYFDSKCYTSDIQIDATNIMTGESVKILFTTTSSRKPITWLYSGHAKGDVYVDVLLGATSRVLIDDGKDFNFSYVLVTRGIDVDGSITVGISMNKTMVHNSSGDGVSLDIYDWETAGASTYLVYMNNKNEGVTIGSDVDINVVYENGYQLTHVFNRGATSLSPNLVLDTEQIPNIVIDKYEQLASTLFDNVSLVWSSVSWITVVPIFILGTTLLWGIVVIIKEIIEGR